MKTLEELCESAQELVRKLFEERKEITGTTNFPIGGGVYVIYEKGEVIYVGKARNLRRRICTDHLSGAKAGTKSAFRRSLHERNGTPFGPEMEAWIRNHCRFAYLPISDAGMRGLVETLAIAWRRTPALLNK